MTFQKDYTTVAQTAANAASVVTAALITAKVITDQDDASAYLSETQEALFDTLSAVVKSDNEMFKAEDTGKSTKPAGQHKRSTGGRSGGRKSSGGGFPGSLKDALALELNSGAFEGVTIAKVLDLSAEEADDDYAYGDGDKSGADYIAWLASDMNKNTYTRAAAALVAEDADIEVLVGR